MTWSYSGDPQNSPLDYVRTMIGDVEPTEPLLSDEQLNAVIAPESDMLVASSYAAKLVAAQYMRKADYKTPDGFSISASQISQHFSRLARDYWERAVEGKLPFCGGLQEAEAQDIEDERFHNKAFWRFQMSEISDAMNAEASVYGMGWGLL